MNKKLSTIASTASLFAIMAMPLSATTSSVITVGKTQSGVVPTITTTTNTNATVGAAPTTPTGQVTATQVTTDTQLNAYTGTVLNADTAANANLSASDDAKIVDVSYQDNGVTVEFTQPAKFLGLFPTNIQAQAIVQADGSTTVNYPWYGFLVRKHAASINSIFQTQITEATAGKADLSTSASASMAPQTKAVILDAIRQVIHGLRSKAAVNASASTTTSAQ